MVKRKIPSIKLTKCGKERLNQLLESPLVHKYHKSLLKSIKMDVEKKNLQKASADTFELLSKEYGGAKCKKL